MEDGTYIPSWVALVMLGIGVIIVVALGLLIANEFAKLFELLNAA